MKLFRFPPLLCIIGCIMSTFALVMHPTFFGFVCMSLTSMMAGATTTLTVRCMKTDRAIEPTIHDRIRAREIELYGGVVSGSLLTDEDLRYDKGSTASLVERIQKELAPPRELIADEARRAYCVMHGHTWDSVMGHWGEACQSCGVYRVDKYRYEQWKFQRNLEARYRDYRNDAPRLRARFVESLEDRLG